jgi:hypothetical protein
MPGIAFPVGTAVKRHYLHIDSPHEIRTVLESQTKFFQPVYQIIVCSANSAAFYGQTGQHLGSRTKFFNIGATQTQKRVTLLA